MVPVPCKILESYSGNLDSSFREANETLKHRVTALEEKVDRVTRERDEARAEADTLKEQQRRAAEALGLNRW